MDKAMMFSCRKVAELLSSDLLASESLSTRLQARFHLWMCRHCVRFARQLAQMRAVARSRQIIEGLDPVSGGESLEDRIIGKLFGK